MLDGWTDSRRPLYSGSSNAGSESTRSLEAKRCCVSGRPERGKVDCRLLESSGAGSKRSVLCFLFGYKGGGLYVVVEYAGSRGGGWKPAR